MRHISASGSQTLITFGRLDRIGDRERDIEPLFEESEELEPQVELHVEEKGPAEATPLEVEAELMAEEARTSEEEVLASGGPVAAVPVAPPPREAEEPAGDDAPSPLADRRGLMAGIAVAIAILVIAGVAILNRPAPLKTAGGGDPATDESGPALEQAKWKFATETAGKGISGSEKKKALREGTQVQATIAELYEALYLDPNDLSRATDATMTPQAARSLRSSNLPLPNELRRIQTTERRGRIIFGPRDLDHAAARIAIEARAEAGKKTVRFTHQATLWLERNGKRWTVIAFDALRRPT